MTAVSGLPRLPDLGFFPTVETLAAQLAAFLALVLGFRYGNRHHRSQ
jgi:high-affinity iron transporter